MTNKLTQKGALGHWLWRFIRAFFLTESPITSTLQLLFGLIAFVSTHLRHDNIWSAYDKNGVFSFENWDWCPKKIYCINKHSPVQIICGIISRFAAGGMYPVLALTLSMMSHSTMYWIQGRARIRVGGGLFLMDGGVKEIHQRCGMVYARLIFAHGVAHCIRFAIRGELKWAACLPMIIAAFIAAFCFLSIPWAIKFIVKKCQQLRYGTTMTFTHHMLVFIGFLGAIGHHKRLGLVFIAFIVLWGFDKLYFIMMLSYSVESPYFTALPHGVLVTFPTPENLKYETGDYIKINIPWLPKPFNKEFHPFSIIPVSTHQSMLYIQLSERKKKLFEKNNIAYNWTGALREYVIQRGSCGASRPILIVGPYAAPFSTSISHRYLLVIASGVGITPALSTISRLGNDRHIILVWASRDIALVRIFTEYLRGKTAGPAVIYLTGPAADEDATDLQSTDFLTIKRGRPDIKLLVSEILDGGHDILFNDNDVDIEESKHSEYLENSQLTVKSCPTLIRSKSLNLAIRPSFQKMKSQIHTKIAVEGKPQPYVPKNTLSREYDDQPLNPHEFKVLYCGGSLGIRDEIATACAERDADFTSEFSSRAHYFLPSTLYYYSLLLSQFFT